METVTGRTVAAGRLKKVQDDSFNDLETYTYGADRQKLSMNDGLDTYYYFWANGSIMAEYIDRGSPGPRWTKSYFYAGSRLILTTSRVNSTTEKKETHHPDRLGTKIVTNVDSGAAFEQSTLPFGTAFGAESSGYSNQVFTSYDRSSTTGLDYANNRTYSSGQGRFTQVDPIGMSAATIGNPQSNNMYAYVQNMPTDFVDPSGLLAVPTTQCYMEVSGTRWTQGDQHLGTVITGTRMVCNQSYSSPQGFAGGGSSAAALNSSAVDLDKLKKAINRCVQDTFKAMQLAVTSISAVAGWSSGIIKFSNPAGGFAVTSYSVTRQVVREVTKRSAIGFTPAMRSYQTHPTAKYFGQVISMDPRITNFVAHDVRRINDPSERLFGASLAIQLHELGHSLAARFLGLHDDPESKDPEWGEIFLDCVVKEYKK